MGQGQIPIFYDEEYSVLVLGPMTSPGTVTISGLARKQNWTIKQAKGQESATTIRDGEGPAEFTATFRLVADTFDPLGQTDFDRWEDFQRLVQSLVAGPKPIALPVYHPDLSRLGVTEVTLGPGGVGQLVHDGAGGATVTVGFLEYRPPKPKPPTKAAATPGNAPIIPGQPNAAPDPNANQKLLLTQLAQQAAEV